MKSFIIKLVIFSCLIWSWRSPCFILAEDNPDDSSDTAEVIDDLSQEIEEKKTHLDQINRKIESYQEEIDKQQAEAMSLENEVALLENRIAKSQLDLEATQLEADTVQLEINIIIGQIEVLEEKLAQQKEILASILRRLDRTDENSILELIFGTDSFSEMFDQLRFLEEVNSDLKTTLDETEKMHQQLLDQQTDREEKFIRLTDLEKELAQEQLLLENEINAKEVLIVAAENSEARFATLMNELDQEEQYIEQQIGQLQNEIESSILDSDLYGDATILSWPVDPSYRGISAYFHDPTYPFRHLFEHPGIDIPQPHGTTLTAPAPGYVAWVKTGQLYGNYIMIIHTNGIATLYAHLSKIYVEPDQFVSRGETIALTGGMPGTSGAGLSTGPHLHFEVRLNGIPVNPLDYLIDY